MVGSADNRRMSVDEKNVLEISICNHIQISTFTIMAFDIFISYRTADSSWHSRLLYSLLTKHFGRESVFIDKERLKAGDRFAEALEENVKAAKVVLVAYLTKKVWLGVDEDGIRKIDRDDDWVRRELEIALDNGKVIIPVFFAKDRLPKEEYLPLKLQRLHEYQRQEFRIDNLQEDLNRLIDALVRNGVKKSDNQPAAELDPLEEELPLPGEDKLGYPKHPYMGLTWFKDTDARIFFGREKEIFELYYNNLTNNDKRLVLFYGQSGAGKSSLLHAGLMPRLKHQGWTVIYRRRTRDGSVKEIADKVRYKLREMCEEAQPLLIIDQLEEIITHPLEGLPTEEEQQALPNLLDELLKAHPKLRIILGFRKEYLADIRRVLRDTPFSEFPLNGMDRKGLIRAVAAIPDDPKLKSKFNNLSFPQGKENLPDYIANKLFATNTGDNAASLLQFALRKMWDEQLEQGRSEVTFSNELFDLHLCNSLGNLLETQLQILSKKLPEAVSSGLAIDLLHFFVTGGQTAGQKSLFDIQERYNHHPPENIEKLCDELTNLYLLSVVDPNNSYRLAHDALAPAVISNFTKSDRPGQLARLILESKLNKRRNYNDIVLTPKDLELISEGKKGRLYMNESG